MRTAAGAEPAEVRKLQNMLLPTLSPLRSFHCLLRDNNPPLPLVKANEGRDLRNPSFRPSHSASNIIAVVVTPRDTCSKAREYDSGSKKSKARGAIQWT